MKCLWITLADPEPATNGQLIYSKGLIEAACDAGAFLTVIGLVRPQTKRPLIDPSGIVWQLGREQPKSSWRRLIARDPGAAARVAPEMVQALEQALTEQSWDAVVFDSICAGWALDRVLHHRRQSTRPPHIVYVAHNHEITVARRVARDARGLKRLLKEIDRMKVIELERRLIASADLLTSNTPDDCRLFAADRGSQPVAFLPPGYGGPRVAARIIDATVPRRAILVGSLDWPPKRVSLEAFLVAGAAILAEADVGLQIVGEVETAYLERLRRRFPSVEFVGPVPDVQSYMAGARLALVPDLLGGFKLKGLDYVFNRLPILAMREALPGMPLRDGHSTGLFDSHRALADGVVAMIDDFPRLNAWHERAYTACADRFDWKRIGRHLLAHMREPADIKRRSGTVDRKSDGASSPARLAAER
jgi:glycosyltransferase involved in cell wall biosynthesis